MSTLTLLYEQYCIMCHREGIVPAVGCYDDAMHMASWHHSSVRWSAVFTLPCDRASIGFYSYLFSLCDRARFCHLFVSVILRAGLHLWYLIPDVSYFVLIYQSTKVQWYILRKKCIIYWLFQSFFLISVKASLSELTFYFTYFSISIIRTSSLAGL